MLGASVNAIRKYSFHAAAAMATMQPYSAWATPAAGAATAAVIPLRTPRRDAADQSVAPTGAAIVADRLSVSSTRMRIAVKLATDIGRAAKRIVRHSIVT